MTDCIVSEVRHRCTSLQIFQACSVREAYSSLLLQPSCLEEMDSLGSYDRR